MFCPNCGFPYGPDDRFCGRCGAALPARAETPSTPSTPPLEEPSSPPPRPKRRRLRYVLPAVLVLAAAAGALAFFLTRPAPLDRSYTLCSDSVPVFLAQEGAAALELWQGTEKVASFSAEEDDFLAVSPSLDHGTQLFVTEQGTLCRTSPQGYAVLAEGADSCALSGDGSTAAWVTTESQLWLQRGEETPVLVDEGVLSGSVAISYSGRALMWKSVADSCYCLSLDGGTPQVLELNPGGSSPILLSDSGTFYYTVIGSGLHLYAWRDGTSTLLTEHLSVFDDALLFNRDGRELLYITEDDGSTVSTWFYREGEEPRRVGSFVPDTLCTPSFCFSQSIYADHLTASQYNVSTLLEKAFLAGETVWLLGREGEASPLFSDGSAITNAAVSTDGNSLVVLVDKMDGSAQNNTLYRFDDLWGSSESQVLAENVASLDATAPDLSVLCYAVSHGNSFYDRTHYQLRQGSTPELLTEGNEFVSIFSGGEILYSTENRTRFFLTDGVSVVPLDISVPEDSAVSPGLLSIGQQFYLSLYYEDTGLIDSYAVSSDGSVTPIEDVIFSFVSW
ncbi:zinc ribbon domain-containing protein [Pseudoflavonifractor sp.]|jgi:hypothetical protein|uniref:zinc ribbon domain-containing protein n=1 Tax=Pseudoflavonifractor sp. TaxID=1980281 RepID=UPI003D8C1F77